LIQVRLVRQRPQASGGVFCINPWHRSTVP
jgi:hypothetical protein